MYAVHPAILYTELIEIYYVDCITLIVQYFIVLKDSSHN